MRPTRYGYADKGLQLILAATDLNTESASFQLSRQQDNSAESPQIVPILPWYVAYTKPNQEQRAAENLLSQGYSIYLPQFKLFKRVCGKQQLLSEPLFPRYLFVQPQSTAQSLAPIRSTLGISNLVRFGGELALVRQETLKSIRVFEELNHAAMKMEVNRFKPGDRVGIIEGALVGLEGLISDVRKERVFVLLSLLGHETRVSMSQHQLIASH